MSSNFSLYGVNGYTGTLIARLAVQQGLRPILAGRNSEKVAPLSAELGLQHRAFTLDDEGVGLSRFYWQSGSLRGDRCP